MSNIVGILLVILYIGLVMGLVTFLQKKKKMSSEVSRKCIHIFISNTFFLAHFLFDQVIFACSLPVLFVFINLGSHYFHWFKAIERDNDTLGTVWYALALSILVYISFAVPALLPYCTIGVIALGYGDGLAALVGSLKKTHRFIAFKKSKKTLEGSMTVFLITLITSIITLNIIGFKEVAALSFIIATIGMALEYFSEHGLDNLTLPLGIVGIGFLVINNFLPINIVLPFVIGFYCFFLAYGLKKLTLDGAIGAVVLAVAVIFFVGYPLFWALLFFLISSNVLEKLRIKKLSHAKREGPRNMKQVIANGLPCFLSAILYQITNHDIFFLLSFVSVAAGNSDTWSGEIGMMGKEQVRGIITQRKMEKGLSGGVTRLGFLGGILGAFSIALFLIGTKTPDLTFAIIMTTIFGCLSSIIDSIIGDLFQGKFYDKKTKMITEDKHQPGTVLEQGIAWVSNNIVNLASNLISCGLFFLFMLYKYGLFF